MSKTNGKAHIDPEELAGSLIVQIFKGEIRASHNGLPDKGKLEEIKAILEPLYDDQRSNFHNTLAQAFSLLRDELPALLKLSDAAQKSLGPNPRPASEAQRRNAASAVWQPGELDAREELVR